MEKLSQSSTIATGGLLGAVLIAAVTHVILANLAPQIIYSEQYSTVFLETLPVGVLAGAVFGAIAAGRARVRMRWVGLATVLLIVGGILMGPLLGIIGAMLISLFCAALYWA